MLKMMEGTGRLAW